MKFTCTRDNLLRGLHVASGIAMKPSNLPILSHIYIRAQESGVSLLSTNLELAVTAQVRAKVEQPGGFTVPAKTLLDYVTLLRDEQITLSLEGAQVIIHSSGSSTKIKGDGPDEYPVIPSMTRQFDVVIETQALKEAFSNVMFAAAKNEIRPELSGIFCSFFAKETKEVVFAATDSYRLSESKIMLAHMQEEKQCIIPARTVAEFVRLLGVIASETKTVTLSLGEGQISLRTDDIDMMSRLIDGNYPDYRQIIPTQFQTTAEISKDAFINSVKAASLFSHAGVNAISLSIDAQKKHCRISSTSAQTGEHASEIDAEALGEGGSVLLNYRYVLEGVQHIEDDILECKMNSADSPCIFKAKSSDDFTYIVMPIRQ